MRLTRLPLWAAIPLSTAAGFLGELAFPHAAWWPLSFVSLFFFAWSLLVSRWWMALLVTSCFGLAFWLPLINWLTLYLGPVPWIALATTETAYLLFAGLGMWLILTRSSQHWNTPTVRWVIVPLCAAAIWTGIEFIRSTWPWGGFAWARTGMSLVDTPFSSLATWVGTAGLTLLVSWLAFSLLQILRFTPPKRYILIPPAIIVVGLLIPAFPMFFRGSVNVAGVQGNTKSGLFDVVQPGDNLVAHTTTTLTYVKKPVGLITWPENASDLNPIDDERAATALTYLSKKFEAPLLVGTITHPAPNTYYNSSLVWTHQGVQASYDKVHPVPFAEWMPARDFFHFLVPDLVDLVTRDYGFGTRPNVIDINGTRVGLAICFDIVDDWLMSQTVLGDAGFIVAQTNNADFGYTDENQQQLAIARMRALETGRWVLNISTVGESALINENGDFVASLPTHVPGAIQQNIPVAHSARPALFVSTAVSYASIALGLTGIALALGPTISKRRKDAPISVSKRQGHTDQ